MPSIDTTCNFMITYDDVMKFGFPCFFPMSEVRPMVKMMMMMIVMNVLMIMTIMLMMITCEDSIVTSQGSASPV